jgi:hypothetical protein
MTGPMAGSVNVNASLAPYETEDDVADDFPESAPQVASAGDLGPCLYFGPAGQRCNRRAVEGGFCSRHQPDSGQFQGLSVPQISRRTVAILALVAVLWPVLADIVRELMRLLH